MKLNFKKVTLKNFLSYEDATFSLEDRGFCNIHGINRCIKDNSISNGSGKSTVISAICYALTGETIQGISKDLKRLNSPSKEKGFASLEFTCDGNEYIVTRNVGKDKNVEIIFNGENVSGKTATESQAVLEKYLPHINRELIGSVILLGQGLPDKFSSLTPIKRKSYLESLLNIDEVYEDINDKINSRESFLKKEITQLNKDIAVETSSLNIYKNRISTLESKIESLSKVDYDGEIKKATDEINEIIDKIEEIDKRNSENQLTFKSLEDQLTEMSERFTKEKEVLTESLNKNKLDASVRVSELKTKSSILEKDLSNFKLKGNVCPTCGRPLGEEYIQIRDDKEKELADIKDQLLKAKEELNDIEKSNTKTLQDLSIKARTESKELKDKYNDLADLINKDVNDRSTLEKRKHASELNQTTLKNKKEALVDNIKSLEIEKKEAEETVNKSTLKLSDLNNKLAITTTRLERVKSIHDLMKTKFRGYLLEDAVRSIRKISKEYCTQIFGHDNLEINQETNSIEIIFQDKNYYSLSGGEKQKIDLILQFSLRKLLKNYSNLDSNVLFLDEIFDNLDAMGTSSIIKFINKEFASISSVFIISHHANELGIEFDNTYTITKNEAGISQLISC